MANKTPLNRNNEKTLVILGGGSTTAVLLLFFPLLKNRTEFVILFQCEMWLLCTLQVVEV